MAPADRALVPVNNSVSVNNPVTVNNLGTIRRVLLVHAVDHTARWPPSLPVGLFFKPVCDVQDDHRA